MVCIMSITARDILDFDEINQCFLITGNSQNKNDSAKSVIDRAARKMTDCTTAQWETCLPSRNMRQFWNGSNTQM